MFTAQYESAFKLWRSSRPEWKALVSAVRDDKPVAELARLASEAGASSNELAELRHVVRMARAAQPRAERFTAAQQRLAELDAEIAAHRKAVESATAAEYGSARARLLAAELARQRFHQSDYLDAEQAASYIEQVAKPAGLI